jgi:uncharacterized OB-fold protein
MTMQSYSKPLPVIDEKSKPFWLAAKNQLIQLPQCKKCEFIRTQFEDFCPSCGSELFEWKTLSGNGTIWSHCVFHQKYFSEFANDLPYGVIMVKLDEGPKLISNLVNQGQAELKIGLRVKAHFEDVTDEITLIKFTPSQND